MNKKYDFLIDTHCHLDFEDYKSDIDSVVKNAIDKNVRYLITISTRFHQFNKIKSLTTRYDNVYCSVGTHPLNTDDEFETYGLSDILSVCENSKVVAIGECGLDYSKLLHDNKREQELLFRLQIECSNISGLPFIIHNRNSDEDMERILLDEAKKNKLKGVLHCFSSSDRLAMVAIELGLSVSFTGIITFKNANSVRDILLKIPNDKIFIETDAPFLAPVPYRGKRNEPAYVTKIAEKISEIKELSVSEVINITTKNSLEFFDKIKV
tara:strand:+ start:139 stop:939 length:801 start_codon:yes stop_codon:yes gene_type:complete